MLQRIPPKKLKTPGRKPGKLHLPRESLRGCEIEQREDWMVVIRSDHGGVELKDYLVGVLCAVGVEVRDCGTHGNGREKK